jgi:hypothetical protein
VAAVGAEKLDVLVPELLVMAIKVAFALRAGHPKNFCHASVPRIFSRQDAKALSLEIEPIPKKIPILPWRLCAFARVIPIPKSFAKPSARAPAPVAG